MEARQLDDFQSKFLEKTAANNERSNFAYMQWSYDIGISYIQKPREEVYARISEN